MIKTVLDVQTERLLGVHMIGAEMQNVSDSAKSQGTDASGNTSSDWSNAG